MTANERYTWYCQKVLPLLFDNSLSYYDIVFKLGEALKDIPEEEKTFIVNDVEELFKNIERDDIS